MTNQIKRKGSFYHLYHTDYCLLTIMDTGIDLKTDSIKMVFKGLTPDQQSVLIQDLMEIARIESIVRINRVTTIAGVDMTAPENETSEAKELRLFRENFQSLITPFLCTFLKIVDKEYMDLCFAVYQLIFDKSVGGVDSDFTDGYLHLCAITQSVTTNFEDLDDKELWLKNNIFDVTEVQLEYITMIADFPDKSRMDISFIDLLVILRNSPERGYMVLMMLGYLEGNELQERAQIAFNIMFPRATKTSDIFTITNGSWKTCPSFKGLNYHEGK